MQKNSDKVRKAVKTSEILNLEVWAIYIKMQYDKKYEYQLTKSWD